MCSRPGLGTTTGSATCSGSTPSWPCSRPPKGPVSPLFLSSSCHHTWPVGSSWAWGASPAQGQAFGAPDEVDERRAGLEGKCAGGGVGQYRGGAGGEAEPVGGAAAGEGVEAEPGELRGQAGHVLEPPRARLVGGDLVGAGGVAGRGEGDGDGVRPGAVGVQPEADRPAGDVRAADAPARGECGDAGQHGRGRDCLGAEDHRVAGAARGGGGAQVTDWADGPPSDAYGEDGSDEHRGCQGDSLDAPALQGDRWPRRGEGAKLAEQVARVL